MENDTREKLKEIRRKIAKLEREEEELRGLKRDVEYCRGFRKKIIDRKYRHFN